MHIIVCVCVCVCVLFVIKATIINFVIRCLYSAVSLTLVKE